MQHLRQIPLLEQKNISNKEFVKGKFGFLIIQSKFWLLLSSHSLNILTFRKPQTTESRHAAYSMETLQTMELRLNNACLSVFILILGWVKRNKDAWRWLNKIWKWTSCLKGSNCYFYVQNIHFCEKTGCVFLNNIAFYQFPSKINPRGCKYRKWASWG